jgi:hypothetical protein
MVERVFFRPTTGAVVGLGLAAAMEILAGYAEIPLAAGLAIVVCLLVSSVLRLASRDGRGVLVGSMALALGGALALGLTAFQPLPFDEMGASELAHGGGRGRAAEGLTSSRS